MQKQKPTMCAQFFIGFKNSPPAGILYQERSNESSLSETSSSQKFQSSQILCDPALLNINLKRCESCRQRRQQYLSCVFLKLFHCKSARGKSIYKLCRVWVWGGVGARILCCQLELVHVIILPPLHPHSSSACRMWERKTLYLRLPPQYDLLQNKSVNLGRRKLWNIWWRNETHLKCQHPSSHI